MSFNFIFYIVLGLIFIVWSVLQIQAGIKLGYFKLDFLKKLNWKALWTSIQEYKLIDKAKEFISFYQKKNK